MIIMGDADPNNREMDQYGDNAMTQPSYQPGKSW